MDDGLVEMVVESVRVHMLNSQHVVILKENGRERYLPIWIGPWEASAIAMKLQGLTPERPLTHDLFATTLDELGVRVDRTRWPWPSAAGCRSSRPRRCSTRRRSAPIQGSPARTTRKARA